MKFLKYVIFTILILLIFMQGFIVQIPGARLAWAFVAVLAFLLLFFFIKPKLSFYTIKKIYRYSAYKYLVTFFIWIFFCGIVFIFLGKISAGKMLYFLIRFMIISSAFIIFPVFLNKFISLRSMIKIIICVLYIAIGFGLFQYIGELFKISVFREIINFFSNYKFGIDLNSMTDIVSGKVRIRGFFHEAF